MVDLDYNGGEGYTQAKTVNEVKLREWLDQECIEIKQLAGRLGVSRHTVLNWLNKGMVPLRLHRARVQKITKGLVKIEEWEQKGKLAYRLLQSSKADELRSKKCMGNDKTLKPKGSKTGR